MPLPDDQLARIFPGDSEMARRMRAFDWSQSDLGMPEAWPANLRTALNICLTTRFPMLLWWGPRLTMLYNDAYITFLSDAKHPRALGRPGRECWGEIWDTIGPMLDGVVRTGEATRPDDVRLIMSRRLPREEVYVRFTYSPILSVDGSAVEGVFTPCTETTEQVVGARRLETLRKLGAGRGEGRSVESACAQTMQVLAENPHDMPFAAVYLMDRGRARLAASSGEAQTGLLPQAVEPDDAPGPWPLAEVARTQEALEIADLGAFTLPGGPDGEPASRAMLLPIGSATDGVAAVLIAAVSPQRPLDAGYRTFLELVAHHIGTAIADARASEHERARTEALAQLDRAKTEFFSNVSHEFRTPLTLMLGPLEEAIARAPQPVRESLQIVQRNSERLHKLVNTLLDFARIEAGRFNARYQQTDVADLTADLASSFRAACERAGLALRVEMPNEPAWAWVDRDMWEKVVLNLLSNALKYTLAGEIAVSVDTPGDRLRLRVADTGVGIPQASLSRVFERFHRLQDGRGRSHEGTGIGLALVQQLVKLHGGSIEVASELDRGSTFTVELPIGYEHLPHDQVVRSPEAATQPSHSHAYIQEALGWLPDAPATQAFAPSPAGVKRARVLVADDNADLRHYVQRLLEPEHEVITAHDGAEALALARETPPDLVVSDVMMPRLDGFGLLQALREDDALKSVPILMLSARAGEEARIEGLAAGADGYLAKPFSARELRSRVNGLLAGAAARSQALADLREHNQQVTALLEHVPVGALLIGADFRVQQINPLARPMFEGIEGGIVGRDFGEVMHQLWSPHFADAVEAVFRRTLATGEPYANPETAERRRDRGVVEYYEWRVDRIPMPDGRHGLVCYFRDISRQVLARKELEASHAALHDADDRKSAFIATLSHELRNPLAPLRNGLEILRRVHDGATQERVRAMMERQLAHMVRLIDDLLDVSRISRGKVELQRTRTELRQVLQHALEASRPFIEQAGHTLEVDIPAEPIEVDADVTRLAQVFINLLNNAAKFTPHGGRVSVRVELADGNALIRITDNGLGVEPQMQHEVFTMFTQVQRGGQGGLGIGLALARGLMQMQGGDITLRSAGRGQGSEFTVVMPLATPLREHPATESQAQPAAAPVHQLRVLVADDNRDSARSLGLILKMQGHHTAVAFDGNEAVTLAERFRPDVMLLDIGMPGRDGYEVASTVRATDWGQDVTLIALTGWGQAEDRRKSEAAGFNHHLLKPVDTRLVEQLLRDAPVSQWPPLASDELPPLAPQAGPQAARKGSSFTS
ncbi:ATP-binding protein [Piscinibacter gummiphilus]|uniref:histidine kinase n=1 Tax=Piscinibacter gummiphilus TaxID=946333 RepID=A0ABZ0CM17_9BURK|nr:ATP-binding protein [Piscinibacter gummiphilus]WOB06031.1 ATP-binding protein [Piscinibacter gummiphilus]